MMLRPAERLAAPLPPLLVAAERVAHTVAQGVHGRRRTGEGESFWQFRPYQVGDTLNRIDWRQSAKGDRVHVRETEWEAAQSVFLWCDASASMRWKSRFAAHEKHERAQVLTLALASLLLRGGEHVRLPNTPRIYTHPRMLEDLAQTLGDTPPVFAVPRHASVVLIGDFLSPIATWRDTLAHFAALSVRGHLVQVLDPAEVTLPYHGHVQFSDPENEGTHNVPRADALRPAYAEALAAHQDALRNMTRVMGWSFATHQTDHPPEAALLALYMAMAR